MASTTQQGKPGGPTSMRDMVLRLMDAKSLDSGFSFSAFLHLNPSPQGTEEDVGWQQSQTERLRWPFEPPPHKEPVPPDHRPELTNDSEKDPDSHGPLPLVETTIFLTTQRFMIFLGSFGVLLIYFGDPDGLTYCHGLHKNGEKWEVWRLVETVEAMKTKVLDPILRDERFKSVWGVFRAVEEVLDLGCIRTLTELRDLMTVLAARATPDFSLVSTLLTEIKNRCADDRVATTTFNRKRSAENPGYADREPELNPVCNGETSESTQPDASPPLSKRRKIPNATDSSQRQVCHCGKAYYGLNCLSNLRRHEREAHSGIKWRCDHCGSLADRRGNLEDHIRRRHPRLPQDAMRQVRAGL